jgi:hypothetical protein
MFGEHGGHSTGSRLASNFVKSSYEVPAPGIALIVHDTMKPRSRVQGEMVDLPRDWIKTNHMVRPLRFDWTQPPHKLSSTASAATPSCGVQ